MYQTLLWYLRMQLALSPVYIWKEGVYLFSLAKELVEYVWIPLRIQLFMLMLDHCHQIMQISGSMSIFTHFQILTFPPLCLRLLEWKACRGETSAS